MPFVATALSGCAPKTSKQPVVPPAVGCAAFEFRVKDEKEIKQARMIMYEASIDMHSYEFVEPMPRWGLNARFTLPMGSTTFLLRSEDGPWVDKYWLRVVHQSGGISTGRVGSRIDTCEFEEATTRFAALRERFIKKWQVRDVDANRWENHFRKNSNKVSPASGSQQAASKPNQSLEPTRVGKPPLAAQLQR